MASTASGRDAFVRTIAQLTQERLAAREVVAHLRASHQEVWEQEIPPAWRTAGFVQELTSAASAELEADPHKSLSLAQLALAIGTSIPSRTYPGPIQAQIEGNAWKEIGNAHRYMSAYEPALRAYDAATRAFTSVNELGLDQAVILLARAIVLSDTGRHDEALALLQQAREAFDSFGDVRRVIQADSMIATIYWRSGRLQEARKLWEDALRRAGEDDLYSRQMLYNNIGLVCSELGDFNTAVQMLHQAIALATELGMITAVSRTEWNLARVLIRTGDFIRAIPMLQRIRGTFLAAAMTSEAGLSGLDLADAFIATRRPEEARILVEQVLAEFRGAGLNTRAITALAYLRDVLPTTPRPQRAVHHVRDYLERLGGEPARLFLPLPEE